MRSIAPSLKQPLATGTETAKHHSPIKIFPRAPSTFWDPLNLPRTPLEDVRFSGDFCGFQVIRGYPLLFCPRLPGQIQVYIPWESKTIKRIVFG